MKHKTYFRLCILIITCFVILVMNTPLCLAGFIDVRISQSGDDVEERLTDGQMYLDSSDLELGNDPDYFGNQSVGLRFPNVTIPQGAIIKTAYLEFETDEIDSEATAVQIHAQATDDAFAFATTAWDLTNRTTTSESVSWDIPAWDLVDEKHQSPDLSAVVQEVVDRAGWTANNSMVFVISGTGKRTAEAFDGETAAAPLLHVEYGSSESVRVSQSEDDVEERLSDGNMNLISTDLELGEDGTTSQAAGMRFQNVGIPQGATIHTAYLEFETDELDTEATIVDISAQAADNTAAFSTAPYDLTSRTTTSASVSWDIPAWNTVNEKHQSPDLAAVVQEIVDRSGWAARNSMVFIISGIGERTAEAYDGDPGAAPLLHVEYSSNVAVPAIFRKTPYLIFPGDETKMAVFWQADRTIVNTSLIEWGETIAYELGSASPSEYGLDHQLTHTITGLVPNTMYHYRVTVDDDTFAGSFMTAPPDEASELTFYAYGDTRDNPSAHNDVLTAMMDDINIDSEERQRFVLHVADWTGGDTESEWDNEFFWGAGTEELVSRIPIMGCRGNHEGAGTQFIKYYPYNAYVPAMAAPAPSPTDFYYSFDYGPLHVSVVDDESSRDFGSDQYAWLENDLASTDKLWKVVMYHQPAWGGGTHTNNTTNQALCKDLIHPEGVSLVVVGHNHNYARCLVPGGSESVPAGNESHHVTAGGGGAPLRAVSSTFSPDYYEWGESTYNFIRFDISGNTLTARAYRLDGSIIETFTITVPVKGDVNDDGTLDLADAIIALKILSGIDVSGLTLNLDADVNEDGKIGIEEAIYILQRVSALR